MTQLWSSLEDDFLIEAYVDVIAGSIRRLGLEKQVTVSSVLDTQPLQTDDLVYGVTGLTLELVANLVSSDGANFQGRNLRCILTPPAVGGGLHFSAAGEPATRFFFQYRNGTIFPTAPPSPTPIDLLNVVSDYARDTTIKRSGLQWLINNPRLSDITGCKHRLKTLLGEHGVATPLGSLLDLALAPEDWSKQLQHFVTEQAPQDGFVLKPLIGSLGANIRLFNSDQLEEADIFLNLMGPTAPQFMVEQRVLPPNVVVEGRRFDWNARVICSLEEEPQVGYTYLRYDEFGSGPVNCTRGALVCHPESLSEYCEVALESINSTAIAATKVVFTEYERRFGISPTGYVGVDCIQDSEGRAFVLEINGGAEFAAAIMYLTGPPSQARNSFHQVFTIFDTLRMYILHNNF